MASKISSPAEYRSHPAAAPLVRRLAIRTAHDSKNRTRSGLLTDVQRGLLRLVLCLNDPVMRVSLGFHRRYSDK